MKSQHSTVTAKPKGRSLNDLAISPDFSSVELLSPGVGRLTKVDENGVLLGGQFLQEFFVGHILWLLFTGKWMSEEELLG